MVRALPIRVSPHPGEGLDSYLEAVAARHHAAWGDVLDAVGLEARSSGRRELYSWLMALPVDRARDLQTSCGVDSATVQSMTVADLIGSVGESHCTAAPMVPVCLSPPRSRFCPACLAETGGRWQLWWRLRWAFACPIHQCLLADTCPCCDRWQRIGPHPHGLVPAPNRCSRKADNAYGRDLRRCGADLSAAPTRRYLCDSAVLKVQSTILGAYRDGCAAFGIYAPEPVSATQLTADLSGLAARILRYAHTEDLVGLLPTDLLRQLSALRCEPSGAPTARGHTRLRGRRDGRRRRRCDARHSPVPIPTPQERNCTGWFRCRGGEVWRSPPPTSGGAATSATLCTVPNYVRCHRF